MPVDKYISGTAKLRVVVNEIHDGMLIGAMICVNCPKDVTAQELWEFFQKEFRNDWVVNYDYTTVLISEEGTVYRGEIWGNEFAEPTYVDLYKSPLPQKGFGSSRIEIRLAPAQKKAPSEK